MQIKRNNFEGLDFIIKTSIALSKYVSISFAYYSSVQLNLDFVNGTIINLCFQIDNFNLNSQY